MAIIKALRGQEIIVDDEDLSSLEMVQWRIHTLGYPCRSVMDNGRYYIVYLHRHLMGLAKGDRRMVDHINGNPLDNRRENLRVCLHKENARNVRIHKDNQTGYKGIAFNKATRTYQAKIQVDGKSKNLGYFASPDLAHEMYCLAADMLHGEFANHGVK